MNIAVIGLSHKTAPVEIREKLSIQEADLKAASTHLCSCPHIDEASILSTCNRLEIYIVFTELEQATQETVQFLAEHSQLPLPDLTPHLFVLQQQDAIKHLMRVAAGLDSLVVGEGQILAQVKQAYKLSQQNRCIKRTLNQLFKQAITIAKRVRTETAIGTGAVSVSSAAVELAQLKVEKLSDCRVAVVGAGKMARRLVQHLLAKGATRIAIINRSIERAQELADQFSEVRLQCYPLTELLSVVAVSDVVFTSTAATEPLLDRPKLEAVLNAYQPLTLFDISVPRNVDANVNELTHIEVFNVDDLQTVVNQNQESRRQTALAAQALIDAEVEEFCAWCRSLEAFSTISCLREKVETIREQELEKALARLGTDFPQKHQEAIEALTRGIVNKILHEPTVQLRTQGSLEAQRLAIQSLQILFGLNAVVESSDVTVTTSFIP